MASKTVCCQELKENQVIRNCTCPSLIKSLKLRSCVICEQHSADESRQLTDTKLQTGLTSSGSSISSSVFEAQAQLSPSADQLTSSSTRPRHEPLVRTTSRPRLLLPDPVELPEPPLDSPATRLVFTCPGARTWFTLVLQGAE